MGTNYIAPIWRMPRNANKDKLSNYSVDFGTTAQYISTPSTWQTDVGLDNVKKLSFSVWVKPTATTGTSGYEAITSQAYGSWNGNFNITYRNDATVPTRLALEFRSVGGIFLNNNTTLTPDTWSHICFVIDLTLGGTLAQEVRCFVNNSEVANQGTATPPLNFLLQTTSFNIGRTLWGSGSSGYQWTGGIAQACFFDYTLSENQIEYLYNLNNPMAISGAEPVAYWPLGDNSNPNANAGYPNISVGADSVFDFATSDSISTKTLTEFGISNEFTISHWVKPSTLTNYGLVGVATSSGNWTDGTGIFYLNNKWHFFVDHWQTGDVQSTTTATTGQWYHLVGTFSTSGDVKFYINGFSENGTGIPVTGIVLDGLDNTYIISSGVNIAGEQTNFQIWNKELTSSEVTTLYNNGQPLMTGTQPQEANLKAWYKLNQSANWEADTVGKWQIPDAVSAYPQSFTFPGTLERILSPANINLQPVTSISISAWVKTTLTSVRQVILSNDNASSGSGNAGRCWSVLLNGQNVNFAVRNSSDNLLNIITSGVNVADDNWHHVVAMWDGTSNSNSQKIFVDGVLRSIGTPTFTQPIKTRDHANQRITVGEMVQQAGFWDWDGELSNIQWWETALTYGTASSLGDTAGGQVAQLYNNGVPLTTAIATDSLKAWYKLDNTEYFNSQDKWIVDNDAITPFYNNALKFINQSNGSGNPLTIYSGSDGNQPANLTFGASDSFSFSTWMWTETTGSNKYLFVMRGSYAAGAQAYNRLQTSYLASNDSQIVSCVLRDDNNVQKSVNSTLATSGHPENGAWSHLVVVVDRTAQTLQLFVNTKGTDTTNISTLGGFEMLNAITLGNDPYTNGRYYYQGRQSNFAIFNKALTQGEIETLYNNGTPEENISFSPVSWWKLNNLTTGLVDSAGGGNDATAASWMTAVESSINANIGVSSGMTEQNLVNNNVSALNGESAGMNTTNLVQSNLTRKVPFSNYSIRFDAGGGDYARTTAGSNSILSGSTSFTISAWVNFANIASLRPIVTNWEAGSASYNYIFRYHNSQLQLYVRANGSSGNALYSWTPTLNTWYNVLGTWDGSTGVIKLYINGADTGVVGTRNGTMPNITVSDNIGLYTASGTNYYMDGKFSNIAYWKNSVLSEDDILNIYNNGITQDLNNFRITPTNWFPMNESYTYFNGTSLILRDAIAGRDATGFNIVQENVVGNAPGSDANGTGNNLAIADLKGNMYNSNKNAYSINMADYADGVTNPANSGRSTDTP
jgi:hypothetical protein